MTETNVIRGIAAFDYLNAVLNNGLLEINNYGLNSKDEIILRRNFTIRSNVMQFQKWNLNDETIFQCVRVYDFYLAGLNKKIKKDDNKYFIYILLICLFVTAKMKKEPEEKQQLILNEVISIQNRNDNSIVDDSNYDYLKIVDEIEISIKQENNLTNFYDFNQLFMSILYLYDINQIDQIKNVNKKVCLILTTYEESIFTSPIKLGLIAIKAALIQTDFANTPSSSSLSSPTYQRSKALEILDSFLMKFYNKELLNECEVQGTNFLRNFIRHVNSKN